MKNLNDIIEQVSKGAGGTIALLPVALIIFGVIIFALPELFIALVFLAVPILFIISAIGFAEQYGNNGGRNRR